MRSPLATLAAATLAASVVTPLAAANWPQWRGAGGQGISNETALPLDWAPDRHIVWKTPVPGRAHSSPIVWGDRVFLTTAIEGEPIPGAAPARHVLEGQEFVHPDAVAGDRRHKLLVLAFDANTGKLLWERTAYDGPVYDSRHRRGSYAAPTPATDGRAIYAYFGSEGAYAFDFDGRQLWKADVGRIKTLGMGVATSPVLYRDLVILQCDEDNGDASFMVALDASTGKEAWRTKRPVQVSWTTPVLVDAGGRTELVANGAEYIMAYDPATGRELWRTKGVESNAIHTPLVGHGLVIVTAGYPAKRTIAIRPGPDPAGGTSRVVWTYDKGTAYVPSSILYGDYLYLLTDKGLVTCLDPRTGEVEYEGGRVPVPATFMASPVAFDGRILLTSEDGDTYVLKAGPNHEILRTNSVGEPVYATPAIANGSIYVRGERHLYRIARQG